MVSTYSFGGHHRCRLRQSIQGWDGRAYMNAPYASLSIRDDAKVKIAPVNSDCECSFWLRSLMGSAG